MKQKRMKWWRSVTKKIKMPNRIAMPIRVAATIDGVSWHSEKYRMQLRDKAEKILRPLIGQVVSFENLTGIYDRGRMKGIVECQKDGARNIWINTQGATTLPYLYPNYLKPSSIKPLSKMGQLIWRIEN